MAAPIDFRCSQVRPWAGLGDADVHLFLVPEQGRVAIADLHDRLYQGPLAPHLRSDLPYLPHITLGRVQTAAQAQALCNELNAQLPPLGGRLGALTVGTLCVRRFEPLARLPLGA